MDLINIFSFYEKICIVLFSTIPSTQIFIQELLAKFFQIAQKKFVTNI